jgi:hypothetical protein
VEGQCFLVISDIQHQLTSWPSHHRPHESLSDRQRWAPSPALSRAAGLADQLPKTPLPTPSPGASNGKRRQRDDEDGDALEGLQGPAGKRPRRTPEPAPAQASKTPSPDVPRKDKGKQKEVPREPSPGPSDEEPSDEEPKSAAEARREVQTEQDARSAAVIRQLMQEDPDLMTYNLVYDQLAPVSPRPQVEVAPVAGPSMPMNRGGGQGKRRPEGGQ